MPLLIFQGPIAETMPANGAYICRGVLPPDLVNAIAMFGVAPDAQIPENWQMMATKPLSGKAETLCWPDQSHCSLAKWYGRPK